MPKGPLKLDDWRGGNQTSSTSTSAQKLSRCTQNSKLTGDQGNQDENKLARWWHFSTNYTATVAGRLSHERWQRRCPVAKYRTTDTTQLTCLDSTQSLEVAPPMCGAAPHPQDFVHVSFDRAATVVWKR